MLLKEERELIVEYGMKLCKENLTVGTFGNISVFHPEKQLMAISPSGMDYFKTKAEDIVVLDTDGKRVDGDREPSSEVDMHRIFYQNRPGIHAVVHTHSNFATTLACMNLSIPPLHYLVAYSGREIPCTKYVPIGTYELGKSALDTMGENYCCLLGNHGLLAVGSNISYAFDVAQQIEFLSELYYRSKTIGYPVLLDEKQVSSVLETFQNYRTK